MKIEVQAFINQIQDQTYLTDEYELATPEPFTSAPLLAAIQPAIEKALEKQTLASFSATTTYHDEPVKVTLETGIVNLPLQYIKKVNQFFDEAAIVDVKLYLYVTSPWINRSGMRIDEIGTIETVAADSPAAWAKISELLDQDLLAVVAGSEAPKVVPEEQPAKKAPAKKKATTKKKATAKKKAPAKKATAKKTTTKKATTKKAAAKKTTTKKAATKQPAATKKTTKKAD